MMRHIGWLTWAALLLLSTGSAQAQGRSPSPGAYTGTVEYSDRAGDGTVFFGLRNLSLSLRPDGSFGWSGFSSDGSSDAQPVNCWSNGDGKIERGRMSFRVTTKDGAPGTSTERRAWKCGRTKIEVPRSLDLSGACKLIGIAEDRQGEIVNAVACGYSEPWSGIDGAKVKVSGKWISFRWGRRTFKLLHSGSGENPDVVSGEPASGKEGAQ